MKTLVLIMMFMVLAGCSTSTQQTMVPAGKHRPRETFKDCADCPEMVVVPGGSFMMGSPASEQGRFEDEGPLHRVSVHSFAAGKYEVTFAEWDACVAAGGCDAHRPDDLGWGRGRRPVITVTWDHAKEYARWLSATTGQSYRLLSEAEWEYAARAGAQTAWHWGDDPDKACAYANIADRAAKAQSQESEYRTISDCDDGAVHTAEVGQYGANGFGLHDMIGNVWEWVEDCAQVNYADAPGDGSAWTDGTCKRRVLRGGSWDEEPFKTRAAYRFDYWFGNRNYMTGFRIARDL